MSETILLSQPIQQLARQLRILAEPNRLRILSLLLQGVQCNCTMGDRLQMPPNLISHHLSILRQAGLIHAERHPQDARWILYSINRPALEALRSALNSFLDAARLQAGEAACTPQLPRPAQCRPQVETSISAAPKPTDRTRKHL